MPGMDSGEAFRMRLQAMSPQEQADLYDASAPVWAGMGITKDIWLRNLAAARAHNEAVEPLRLVYEAALAISPSEAVRDAVQTYQQALKEHGWMNPQNKGSAQRLCEGLPGSHARLRRGDPGSWGRAGDRSETRLRRRRARGQGQICQEPAMTRCR